MGHMSATKRIKRESKRVREDNALAEEMILRTVNFTLKSVAISLYEVYGFHNKRSEKVLQDAVNRVDEFIDRYGSDCVEAAMDRIIEDYGLEITLKAE